MKIYTIRYVSNKTLSACFDTQLAHNILAAYQAHKDVFPDSKRVQIRRHSDGGWTNFGSEWIS